jgi:hypothetical protein
MKAGPPDFPRILLDQGRCLAGVEGAVLPLIPALDRVRPQILQIPLSRLQPSLSGV